MRELWHSKIGLSPAFDRASLIMFKSAVIKSQSDTVRKDLERVVGLDRLNYDMWSDHIIQHIDKEVRDKEAEQQEMR